MSRKDTLITYNSAFVRRFTEACGSSEPATIARLLNISYQAAKNYLQGRLPGPNILISIAKQTPYSIHWLLTGRGEKFAETHLGEDADILTDRMKALIKDECRSVIGELVNVSVEDAQEKVIVLKSEDIKEERIIKETDTLSNKSQ